MYCYDIRKQIRTENRRKLIGEIVIMITLVFITALILLTCNLKNPFVVVEPSNSKQLDKAYKSGVDYVRFKHVNLEFTGYYKTNESNEIIYNCYALTLDDTKYFVFVPAKDSDGNKESPKSEINNYSFTANMQKDWKLIEKVSKDYDSEKTEFLEEYGVSDIILNEAKSDRMEMYLLWALFMLIVIISLVYLVLSLLQVKLITRDKAVKKLVNYGNIQEILDSINKEVLSEKIYESGKTKLLKNWIISFDLGDIHIIPKQIIQSVTLIKEKRKVYGFFSIGEANFMELTLTDGAKEAVYVKSSLIGEEMKQIIENEYIS
ncbi:hypothetical protein bsdtb5_41170 [Anaeromicropila herbilytica]|uniref:Uncharacterized protein n=2 Tax=Anaeromicropila herbilytica TaxID=2785025 RepID=A0A7R7EQU4_9FIRM|nr:hypothetical protein bsdtb5_41170 [Anaeromicropila herbilytica]